MTVVTTAPARPRAVLYHGPDAPLDGLLSALEAEGVERQGLMASVAELTDSPDSPAVLLLDPALARATPDLDAVLAALPDPVVVVATDEAAEALAGPRAGRILLTLPATAGAPALRMLQAAFRHAAAKLAASRMQVELADIRDELRELTQIGMALMTERDPDRLLKQILDQARRLTESDAGSIYLVEQAEDATRRLRFTLAQNDTLPELPLVKFTLPIDARSAAGYAAVSRESFVLEDAYEIPEHMPFSHNKGFDERFGYRTKSMLVVPMVDHRDEVVGVLQLINRKRAPAARITDEESARRAVVGYTDHEVQIVRSLAGQAAVSIENAQLYQEIQKIFESFVKAAVTAIDQRDPTTAGHSLRVATLTCDLAEATMRGGTGPYADFHLGAEQMRELRYAGLLHDFGKVGVREEVLVKAKKLPPFLYERVEARFDLVRRTLEAEYFKRRAQYLEQHGRSAFGAMARAFEEEFQKQLDDIERLYQAVRSANEPSILPEQAAAILDDIARRSFPGVRGEHVPYITEDELHFLSIPKGTLDERERKEIESHVEQTFRFLTQIPWTDDLKNVAAIAYGHHEKLNGKGYPRGIAADQIPAQTRMMTIADIFDALTASDRPYKRAVPLEKALDILRMEAKDDMLDRHLVELLIESQVYQKIIAQDWRALL